MLARRARSARTAASMAGSTLTAVVEPPETEACGKRLSPSCALTRVMSMPSASAAHWAMMV